MNVAENVFLKKDLKYPERSIRNMAKNYHIFVIEYHGFDIVTKEDDRTGEKAVVSVDGPRFTVTGLQSYIWGMTKQQIVNLYYAIQNSNEPIWLVKLTIK